MSVFYESSRLRLLVDDPPPALLVLVRADSDPSIIAEQLRKLADEIERAPGSLPALVSDAGPPMTAYVSETSEGLKALDSQLPDG